MNADNTLIIGVVSEVPYSEFMGDRNNPYCQNLGKYNGEGCKYNDSFKSDPYLPLTQPNNMTLGYEQNAIM